MDKQLSHTPNRNKTHNRLRDVHVPKASWDSQIVLMQFRILNDEPLQSLYQHYYTYYIRCSTKVVLWWIKLVR